MEQLIDDLNEVIEKVAQKKPEDVTFVCHVCEEEYVAEDLSDFIMCPNCGKMR